MSLLTQFKRLHKWIALVVGLQLLLWVISGLVFSFIDHKLVKGRFIYKAEQASEIKSISNFSNILKLYPNATQVTQLNILNRQVVKISMQDSEVVYDIAKGIEIDFSETLIRQIAELGYKGGGQLSQLKLQSFRNDENRGMSLPVWQLDYDDQYSTHLYLSANSGELLGVRTDSWRIFDFFMMLHFMDYGDRGNFNSPLIIFFALVMLMFSISGMLLLYSGFSVQDFSQLFYRFMGKRSFKVRVLLADGKRRNISLTKDCRLLDGLEANGIETDSICGGGGICGGCQIKITSGCKALSADLAEHDTLDDNELSQGYRLACQLIVNEPLEIEFEQSI